MAAKSKIKQKKGIVHSEKHDAKVIKGASRERTRCRHLVHHCHCRRLIVVVISSSSLVVVVVSFVVIVSLSSRLVFPIEKKISTGQERDVQIRCLANDQRWV